MGTVFYVSAHSATQAMLSLFCVTCFLLLRTIRTIHLQYCPRVPYSTLNVTFNTSQSAQDTLRRYSEWDRFRILWVWEYLRNFCSATANSDPTGHISLSLRSPCRVYSEGAQGPNTGPVLDETSQRRCTLPFTIM